MVRDEQVYLIFFNIFFDNWQVLCWKIWGKVWFYLNHYSLNHQKSFKLVGINKCFLEFYEGEDSLDLFHGIFSFFSKPGWIIWNSLQVPQGLPKAIKLDLQPLPPLIHCGHLTTLSYSISIGWVPAVCKALLQVYGSRKMKRYSPWPPGKCSLRGEEPASNNKICSPISHEFQLSLVFLILGGCCIAFWTYSSLHCNHLYF